MQTRLIKAAYVKDNPSPPVKIERSTRHDVLTFSAFSTLFSSTSAYGGWCVYKSVCGLVGCVMDEFSE